MAAGADGHCETTPPVRALLLSHLLRCSDSPDDDWSAPWDVDDLVSAPAELRDLVHHAEMFSLVIQGARLLYNRLLAERYEELGLTSLDAPVDGYREVLDEWAVRCEARRDEVAAWQVSALWPLVALKAPRISPATKQFVESWVNAVQSQDCHTLATDPALRRLVADREFQNKRAQSRLRNEKLLATWQGASGTTPLVYRWFQARRIVTDIFEGLGRADADNRATFLEQRVRGGSATRPPGRHTFTVDLESALLPRCLRRVRGFPRPARDARGGALEHREH
ncbi:hypothetical protein GS881_23295 [Rhodococcus hoagii]|nr:hypothetical protein [Prescottella equi]